MSTNDTARRRRGTVTPASGGLGFFGLLRFVGALVWPAYLVYGLLQVSLG